MTTTSAPGGPGARWRWLLAYFRGRKRIWVFALIAGLATAAANVALLLLLHHAIDVAIPGGHVTGLLLVGAAMIVSKLAAACVTLWMTRLSSRQVTAATADLQVDLAARLHRLRWSDVHQIDASAAHARLVHDAHAVSQMAMRLATAAVPALVPFLASVTILFLIDWRLAAIVLVLLPATRALSALGAWRLRGITLRFKQAFDAFHRGTRQLLHMLPATRTHGVSRRELGRYRAAADDLAQGHAALATGTAVSEQAGALGATILLAVILVGGGLAVSNGAMSIGTLTAFLVAATQAQGALASAGGAIPAILSGDAALERLLALHTTGREDRSSERPAPRPASLSFEGVDARIGERQILAGVSFDLRAGETIAIVAPNGEGKTTLLNIALGLVDCDAGQVRVDGVDLASIDREGWRRSVGILPQHPLFANARVGDNIGFAAAGAEDVGSAPRFFALDALIEALPGSLDAPMGENGALLSGGERQRVALTRALSVAPSLLVLDEPSNHLDSAAVALLVEQLLAVPDRPAILMATHDARLLRHADRIYRLEAGRLIALDQPATVAIAS